MVLCCTPGCGRRSRGGCTWIHTFETWIHSTPLKPRSPPLKLLVCWVVGLPIARGLHRAIITPCIVVGAVHQAVRNAEHDGAAAHSGQVRRVAETLDEDEPVGVDVEHLGGFRGTGVIASRWRQQCNAGKCAGIAAMDVPRKPPTVCMHTGTGNHSFSPGSRPASQPLPSLWHCRPLLCQSKSGCGTTCPVACRSSARCTGPLQ